MQTQPTQHPAPPQAPPAHLDTEDIPILDLTAGCSIDLSESACAEPYRLASTGERGQQLLAEGYPRSVVPFLLRLEGRENTLLDITAARSLTAGEEGELRAIGRTLDELKALAKGHDTAVLEPSPIRETRPPARLRRVPEAATTTEALRRLLHVRGSQWERHTGEDWDAHRPVLIEELTGEAKSSKALGRDELSILVDWMTTALEQAGFDLKSADAEYAARREQREAVFGEIA